MQIKKDNIKPQHMERSAKVFYGKSGTGKSKTAFEEAGDNFYIKNPNTKFWDGYRGEENVIIDEFRGRIDISYLLMWLDRYACNVEVKGSATPLNAKRYWITSNLSPEEWYPECDQDTKDALKRRIKVVHFLNLIK